jgi:ribosomal RNA assembly protein
LEPEIIKVPKFRLGALIGKNGQTKKEIEKLLGVKIRIDSSSGCIEVSEGKNLKDALGVFKAEQIIKAIARGFNPNKALLLANDNYYLNIIDLTHYVKESNLERVRSRIIGESGKARKNFEENTNTFISVQGKTVGIIGEERDIENARQAIEMIIGGAKHDTVYRYLREQKTPEFQM